MTNQELNEVKEVCETAVNDTKGAVRSGNLNKPTVPPHKDADHFAINGMVVEKMWRIVCLRKLSNFYTQDSLQKLVNRACMHDYRILMRDWNIATIDMTVDLAVLGLYDIVIYGDDSSSMRTEEPNEDNMTRHQLMIEVVKTLSFWATLMDVDGVVVRFMNSTYEGNGISNPSEVDEMFRVVKPSGCTPMGSQLDSKILNQFVYPMLASCELERPILVITVTDGKPDNEADVIRAISNCHRQCQGSYYGEHAVAFSFAQIGTSGSAAQWLSDIDEDKTIGHLIDCTSEYHMEKAECEKAYPGIVFTEATWLVKLMIGPIDPEYDQADEVGGKKASSQPAYNQPAYGQPAYSQPAYNPHPEGYPQPAHGRGPPPYPGTNRRF